MPVSLRLLTSLLTTLPRYLADISTKSANYCVSQTTGNVGLLLLCEVELGKPPLKLTHTDYDAGERAKEANCLSTFGVGQTAPASWKDAGCVHSSLKGVNMPDVKQIPRPSNEANAYLLCEWPFSQDRYVKAKQANRILQTTSISFMTSLKFAFDIC